MNNFDWLDENNSGKTNDKVSKIGKDIIRHSSTKVYQDLNFPSTKGKKDWRAIVTPDLNASEKQTNSNCIQNRLYATDWEGYDDVLGNNDESGLTRPMVTLYMHIINRCQHIKIFPKIFGIFACISCCNPTYARRTQAVE